MKKKIYFIGAGLLLSLTCSAQLSKGGFPISFNSNVDIPSGTIELKELTLKDIHELLDNSSNKNGPYMVAKSYPVDIQFPSSGTLVPSENGGLIWKVKVTIPNSKGIGLHFDNFQLPQGVEMFVYNENKKHVLGAYTIENTNGIDNNFVIEAVQGETAYLELNIPDKAMADQIALSLDFAQSYFRSVDYLDAFSDYDGWTAIDMHDDMVFGTASVCMINAVCPQSDGFENARKATLQTLYPSDEGVGVCSATLINNTGNTATSCTPYVLTASHCEGTGSFSSSTFSNVLLRFDFQQENCTWSSTVPNAKTLTGASLIARSAYTPEMEADPGLIMGDFMLLKPTSAIPEAWGTVLNGWNRSPSPTLTYTGTDQFIGFHHPHGDIKSLSTSKVIQNSSLGATGTHWATELDEGYAGQGSSGSALFNNDGLILGVASVAAPGGAIPGSCKVDRRGNPTENVMGMVAYSKFSYDWENPGEAGASDNRKLKPWLDPSGTGAMTVPSLKSNCQPLSDTSTSVALNNNMGISANIFPNPSIDGKVHLSLKMNEPQDLSVEVYDITGKRILSTSLYNALDQVVNLDLSQVANGVYMIKLSNSNGTITQKVAINK